MRVCGCVFDSDGSASTFSWKASVTHTHVSGISRASERSHASGITNGSRFLGAGEIDQRCQHVYLSSCFIFFLDVHQYTAQSNNNKKVDTLRPSKVVPPETRLESMLFR